ncbi:MAG TPA: hypothetical protein VG164_14095 [Trebonia sp.]|nr:hypothetical protein [Trebonia sp.]
MRTGWPAPGQSHEMPGRPRTDVPVIAESQDGPFGEIGCVIVGGDRKAGPGRRGAHR